MRRKLQPSALQGGNGTGESVPGGMAFSSLLEGGIQALPPTSWALTVEDPGRVRLPESVRNALSLGPRDLISLQRHAISLRLDFYREVLEAVQSGLGGWEWPSLEQFLRRSLTSVDPAGSVEIPGDLMVLAPGDRLVLEVVREGPGHALYLYQLCVRR